MSSVAEAMSVGMSIGLNVGMALVLFADTIDKIVSAMWSIGRKNNDE